MPRFRSTSGGSNERSSDNRSPLPGANHHSTTPTSRTRPRTQLDQELEGLANGLLELASRVEKAIPLALYALKSRNHYQSQQVILNDRPLNQRRYEIEQEALTLLTLQQPLAGRELRYVVAALQVSGELERMGDYAKGIAIISDRLSGNPPLAAIVLLEEMGHQAVEMLHAAMDAFMTLDGEAAARVEGRDDALDGLYERTQRTLIEAMVADPAQIDLVTPLLWAAHNLERVGDRVGNICGRINFVNTGQVKGNAAGEVNPPSRSRTPDPTSSY